MKFHFPWPVAAAIATALALAACQRSAPAPGSTTASASTAPPPAVGQPAEVAIPSLRVTTVDGKPWDLAGRRGRWVVVNFWATWCGPCLKEMPELSALDAMREHVEVIGLDYEDTTPAALQAFLRKHPVVYPVAIVDVYAPPRDFAPPRGLPTTFLIAPDGKVAKHFLGPVSARDIDDAIAAAGGPKAG
ncbi:MAG TPA: TlpA disulfide reductase family protein [Xanthomonadaceae bacterium]|nr:TlpA disulfide reductase family protein [Xanthomonadaceae bacterium]